MILRRVGGILRGKATPVQVFLACVLASMTAFAPGFSQAPGLVVLWVVLLVVLNANLFLAGVVGTAAKLVSLLLVPVSFSVGRILLDGPTQGLFAALVNAPVFAWFGFEYYVVTGGQLLGLIFGVACGVLAMKLMRSLWKRLASIETGSAAFQEWSNKGWVKVAAFIFVGGLKGKKSFADLHTQRLGNPIRIPGVIVVAVLSLLTFLGVRFAQGPFLTAAIKSGLETVNGATVDLERAELDLAGGRLTLHSLALADPEELSRNVFSASVIEAKISTTDLLRKRAALDQVVVVGGREGDERETPGERVISEPGDSLWSGMEMPDAKSLEDFVKNARVWKDRLSTVGRWIERLSGSPADAGPTYEEVLRERVRLLGYDNVRNEALIERAPTFLIRRIEADEVHSSRMPDDLLTVRAENLSTHPRLVAEPPRILITSQSGRLRADLSIPQNASVPGAAVDLVLKGLDVDAVAAQLTDSDPAPIRGGTMDVSVQGLLSTINSDLPLRVALHDTSMSIAGSRPTEISQLTVPIDVRGPIANPAIRVDQSGLQRALVSAGKDELSRRLGGELQRRLGSSATETEEPAKIEDTARDILGGFLRSRETKREEKPKTED